MKIKLFHTLLSVSIGYWTMVAHPTPLQRSAGSYNKKTGPTMHELSVNTKPIPNTTLIEQVRDEQPVSDLPKRFGIEVAFDQKDTRQLPGTQPSAKQTPPVPAQKDPEKELLLKKTIRDMTLDELLIAKPYAEQWDLKDLMISYNERLIVMATDHEYQELIRSIRLQLADLYFQKGDMKKAGKLYREYVKFYPGNLQRDYAEYKTVLTRFYNRLKPPKDQSKTRKTVMLAHSYLQRASGSIKEYTIEVKNILDECYRDLYDYEISIFNHYFNLERFKAAQTRLENIKADFIVAMPHIEPELLEYEIALAQKQGNLEIAQTLFQTMSYKFPTHAPKVTLAQATAKKSFADRF
jgi:outer membrane assembly lipoprotein YfiO